MISRNFVLSKLMRMFSIPSSKPLVGKDISDKYPISKLDGNVQLYISTLCSTCNNMKFIELLWRHFAYWVLASSALFILSSKRNRIPFSLPWVLKDGKIAHGKKIKLKRKWWLFSLVVAVLIILLYTTFFQISSHDASSRIRRQYQSKHTPNISCTQASQISLRSTE